MESDAAGQSLAGGTQPIAITTAETGPQRARVEQLYKSYLNVVYATEYYKALNRELTRYTKHLDFAIALGAAASGGTGLGILADPRFAWFCAVLTTVSVVLTTAKTTYDWPGKTKINSDMIEKYGKLSGKYQMVIDDLHYKKDKFEDLDGIFRKLRDEEAVFSMETYPSLAIDKQREIQNSIKSRIDYNSWWRPD